MISVNAFDVLDIPMDKNWDREIVARDVGISQENQQRAKALSAEE